MVVGWCLVVGRGYRPRRRHAAVSTDEPKQQMKIEL